LREPGNLIEESTMKKGTMERLQGRILARVHADDLSRASGGYWIRTDPPGDPEWLWVIDPSTKLTEDV
jgi:hypothetical protein